MSKYQVKVGLEFNVVNVVVTVETASSENNEVKKPSLFTDWKFLSVLAVFILVFSSGVYGAVSGDHALYDKLLDVAITVAEHPHGKN